MSRGGQRPGAGRPVGAKSRVLADVREHSQAVLQQHGAKAIKRLLATRDDRVLLGVLGLLYQYAYGRPAQNVSVQHSAPSVERILEELARKRLGRATDTATRLLPAASTEEP